MFGKSPREPQKPTLSDLQDIRLTPPSTADVNLPQNNLQDTLLQKEIEETKATQVTEVVESNEAVSTAERISRIASPYFVAIVGLALYKENFLIGTVLILIGILSLLKITTKDIGNFLEWLKNFLGLNS